MKRITLVFMAAILTAGVLASIASAQEVHIGVTTSPVIAPVCPPKNCNIVLDQVTAVESIRDGVSYPTTVKKAGELVAFTIGVSGISTNKSTVASDVAYLNNRYGGPPQVEVSVLRPVGPRTNFKWAIAAQSLPLQLAPYLGDVTEFPLVQPLPVIPGEVIGVTIPTWAPLLTINLTSSQFAYRQSRSTGCTALDTPDLAQLSIGDQAGYRCSYSGTRIEYSATEVTSPTPHR